MICQEKIELFEECSVHLEQTFPQFAYVLWRSPNKTAHSSLLTPVEEHELEPFPIEKMGENRMPEHGQIAAVSGGSLLGVSSDQNPGNQ